jgi:hypothetical protein
MIERVHDLDDRLERALADAGPTLADDGFTDRVMARLPARPRRRARPIVLGVTAALAGGVLVASPGAEVLARTVARLAASGAPSPLVAVAVAVFVATTLGATVYAALPD